MAQSNIVTEKRLIKCAACLKVFDIPMRLPCNHHYCLHCLRLFTKVKGRIQCQICKSWHTMPDEGVNGFTQVGPILEPMMHIRIKFKYFENLAMLKMIEHPRVETPSRKLILKLNVDS